MERCRSINLVCIALLSLYFYQVAVGEKMRYGMSCDNGVCYRVDDEGPCVEDNNKPKLFRWEPIRVRMTPLSELNLRTIEKR
jgi:hypothetical protein